MADVLRSCSKTACRWPAAASLSYRYATRQVWLLDLAPAADPSLYDLCPHHADALIVPRGWESVDDRTEPEIMVEPSADDRAVAAARRRAAEDPDPTPRQRPLVSAGAGRNRYAALAEQLPRLAAEVADAAPPTTITSGPRAQPAPDEARSQVATAAPAPAAPPRPPAVMPSRDLAPIPPQVSSWRPDEEPDPPGQLMMPVEDDGDDIAVVVPFSPSGPRRRRP